TLRVPHSFPTRRSSDLVSMFKYDELLTEAATGDGPISAAFRAIERTVGFEVHLEDYSLKGVTEGADALGEATVRVRKDNRIYVRSEEHTSELQSRENLV